ncbi:MAG: hypothetical protein LBP72_07390 [Dysgonamonadaceae bacterium]|jgi:hypothetical protein|nr:hypothetical protein [Dysgonamonadaceae bacterium]
MTTTNTYSKDFSTDNWKVKVIMDDCHSLTENNELAFSPTSISPNFGSTAGGNTIYIYGDFQYAATSDYAAQSDLVAHYDGINNRGLGDKSHDYNATAWKDLKTGFELPRGAGDGQWLTNGFQSLEPGIVGVGGFASPTGLNSFFTNTVPNNYPVGGADRTVEVIFRTPENMFTQQTNEERWIFAYGEANTYKLFGFVYRGLSRPACGTDNPWIFYAIAGGSTNLVTCLSSTLSLETPNTINTVTSTYRNNMADLLTNSLINNTQATIIERSGTLNTGTDFLMMGLKIPYATILSLRLYNRVLTSEEIENNAKLDQKRYLTPPSVTIDGKDCTDVVVLSPHFLMCKVPEGSSKEKKEIRVTTILTAMCINMSILSVIFISAVFRRLSALPIPETGL